MSTPVSANEKSPELTIEHILAKTNRRLPYDLQIRPDDPILSVLALNEELMDAYMVAIKQAIREAQLATTVHSQQMTKIAEDHMAKLLEKLGNEVEARFQKAGTAWKERMKAKSEAELAKIRAATLYAQIGGIIVLVGALFAFGRYLGNFIFH